jgi:hypothetical protein
MMKRSFPNRPEPDLFIFGLLGSFKGYFPGYSAAIAREDDFFSWAILKAHTNNAAGRVTLRSADPRDVPEINFHYFDEGSGAVDDLASVAEGVETVRRITARCQGVIARNPPGEICSAEQIRSSRTIPGAPHVCTCKMGLQRTGSDDSRSGAAHNLGVVMYRCSESGSLSRQRCGVVSKGNGVLSKIPAAVSVKHQGPGLKMPIFVSSSLRRA